MQRLLASPMKRFYEGSHRPNTGKITDVRLQCIKEQLVEGLKDGGGMSVHCHIQYIHLDDG